jgi:hypothetical protein
MGKSPRTASIHILDDDCLLHVFQLYRPFLLGEDDADDRRLFGGESGWVRGRWWYRLAHVCQRWRDIILGSASYLDLSLVCTYGTPVADMLEHSPPLPLDIDFYEKFRDVTAEDEEGAILALKKRDRVRRVRIRIPVTGQQKLIAAMDDEYPILEYLVIGLPIEDTSTILMFPETLRAPHLRHLTLRGFALPVESQLLTSAVGLVTLYLIMVHQSTYFHPNTLLQWISLMPRLETLTIFFKFPVPNHGVERQIAHTPLIAPVTLPNLHHFQFHGISTYLEAIGHRIATPRLKKLRVNFFNQLTYFVPHLLHLVNTSKNLGFASASLGFFDKQADVVVYPNVEAFKADVYALGITLMCSHLDRQVSSVAQISYSLSQIFSVVEDLFLQHKVHSHSPEEHNEVGRTEWRRILIPFTNVKTIWIDGGLVKELSRCLELENGESPLELLPEVRQLIYYGSGDISDAFTSFINARRNAGRPVTLIPDRPSPPPNPSSSVSITPANSEAGND